MFQSLNNLPQVTKNFLIINVLLFILMQFFYASSGLDISNYLASHYVGTPFFEPYQAVTHMFMHSRLNFMHIVFNMLILVIFGSHLERLWGAKRFFIFYFAAGLGAFALDNVVNGIQLLEVREQIEAANISIESLNNFVLHMREMNDSELDATLTTIVKGNGNALPAVYDYLGFSLASGVGASGALFGLMAAFAMLFPNTELYIMFLPIPIKAKYLIGGYVLFEVIQAVQMQTDHINHLAHIGGALTGAIIVLIWRYTDRKNFY
ncbi:MAG: rhomboid family intramembrane serine protease [Crocinitomicaceae bacterium]|jgi:rhomboid-like protein|nr:rhomboid family intramembrane serine protease [Crocinitomicaceae bacterium]